MNIESTIFEPLPHGGWCARIPFTLIAGVDSDVSVDCPTLEPGFYSISAAFIINSVPSSWAVRPRDIAGSMNFDTEGSVGREEMTPLRRTSDFRTLGMFVDGSSINNAALPGTPWPWGTWRDVFHTTMGGGASYDFAFNEQGAPDVSRPCPTPFTQEELEASAAARETVGGWIYLLLKRED